MKIYLNYKSIPNNVREFVNQDLDKEIHKEDYTNRWYIDCDGDVEVLEDLMLELDDFNVKYSLH